MQTCKSPYLIVWFFCTVCIFFLKDFYFSLLSILLKISLLFNSPNSSQEPKKDSKGNTMYWTGYKLHLDVVCGCIPVSALVTSASVHDSQVAIPLATITAQRTTVLYDLMDSAYDIPGIIEHSRSLGHVPLIDKNPRGNKDLQAQLKAEAKAKKTLNLVFSEEIHYNARTTVERANSRLKDEFGACQVRVRGHAKVTCHLMFSVLVLAADQLMRLVI
jgi:Transposase DDE domain